MQPRKMAAQAEKAEREAANAKNRITSPTEAWPGGQYHPKASMFHTSVCFYMPQRVSFSP